MLVVVGLISIIATIALQYLTTAQKEKRRLEVATMLENKRSIIGHEITKSKSRRESIKIETNYAKDCDPGSTPTPTFPLTSAACGSQFGGTANFTNENGTLIVETLTANVGFDYSGQRCTTFDATAGNDACPFRAEMRWLANCVPTGTTGACQNPEIFYDVTFLYKPASNAIVINPAKYAFNQNSFGVFAPRWIAKNSSFNAESGENYVVDTSGGSNITATLPSNPSIGDTIAFLDGAGTFDAYKLIIDGNGQKIMGESLGDVMDVDVKHMSFELIYFNTTNGWRIK